MSPDNLHNDTDWEKELYSWLFLSEDNTVSSFVVGMVDQISSFSADIIKPPLSFETAADKTALRDDKPLYHGIVGLQTAVLRFLGNVIERKETDLYLYSDYACIYGNNVVGTENESGNYLYETESEKTDLYHRLFDTLLGKAHRLIRVCKTADFSLSEMFSSDITVLSNCPTVFSMPENLFSECKSTVLHDFLRASVPMPCFCRVCRFDKKAVH